MLLGNLCVYGMSELYNSFVGIIPEKKRPVIASKETESSQIGTEFFRTALVELPSVAQQDNGIVGDPLVDCADSYFEVRFETRNPFRGLVFVQDRLDDPHCRSPPASPSGHQNASLRLAFKECGVERRTSLGGDVHNEQAAETRNPDRTEPITGERIVIGRHQEPTVTN
ncbi:hypothetical protein TELCIR_00326 [Teladorsagia circumcincta]|uniref:ZP domain-containing protein n=1 Tax=Teladorsagia circumcincta TaxID=45464 RepID=A0A2G9V4Z6_TELCI|nr:hypothetical protein TELCIR_00326 [Teladorsagia circumcincta]